MDSSSIQFSGTCVASKLRRYCRRSLARLARSAGEGASDDDDDVGAPLRGGLPRGARTRRSLSGIGSDGIFSLFRSGLSGPLRSEGPAPPPTGSAVFGFGFGCGVWPSGCGVRPSGSPPPDDDVFAATTRPCGAPNACPPANPHCLAGNTSDTGVLLNSPARSRSRSLASGAAASGSRAWLNDRRKRSTHADETSWTSRPPRPTHPSIVVVSGATIAMSVKSKCIAASTTALNAMPDGSRVPRCEPSQSLKELLNEFARERRSAPEVPPEVPRWPRNGARSDSQESVLAGGRPARSGGPPLEPPPSSPPPSVVVAGGLTASRISVHPELLPERASASPPEPAVPASIPSPPDDPARPRRLDLLPDLERTSDPACDPPPACDPLPPPSPIAARLSWLELRGCCGRRKMPCRTDVGVAGGDPAW
mmetsp:Transcript_4973/g.22266  ORF Transcript_4973/g.22266 Transcript_4973/m.22266 type:complete len:422 (+) Transcript_4973:829-2094(+)